MTRRATPEDLSAMIKVLETNYSGEDLETGVAELEAYLRNPDVTFYVIGDPIVAFGGFAPSYFDWDTSEFFWVNVSADIQGSGYGRTVVLRMLQETNHKNVRTVYHRSAGHFGASHDYL